MLQTSVIIVVVSVLAEAVWENLKQLFPETGFIKSIWEYINKIGSLITGVLLALVTGVNIFPLLGVNVKVEVLGVILTGILLGRGSNYVHDLLSKLKPKNQQV
jgi:hypothetical protein